MKFPIGWLLFGLPLGAAIIAGIGFCYNWKNERHRLAKVLAVTCAVFAPLLGCIATAYVQLVRPLPAFDYSVEATGLLLSVVGTFLGLVTLHFPRWFSSLALGVSIWTLVWFFLLGSTY